MARREEKHLEPMTKKNMVYCNFNGKSISFNDKYIYNRVVDLLSNYEQKYGFYLVEE